jgi:hypothetical protein
MVDNKQPTHEMSLMEPGIKSACLPRNWLQRWWSPDPRRAPRESAGGMAAYYWNGAPPQAHEVRDISSSGLYVITEERWYPGTLVLMTLQRNNCGEEIAERAISVHSRAVRWGADGVGLQFMLSEGRVNTTGLTAVDGVDRKQLERFLRSFRKDKG